MIMNTIKYRPLYPPTHSYKRGLPWAALMLLVLLWPSAGLAVTNPQSGSVDVTSQVLAEAPNTAAVIVQPTDGQHFDHNTISVVGSCPYGSFVEIYKNGIFAGVTPCQSNDSFSISISLVPGKNELRARVRNITDLYGPDSATVNVYYDVSTGSGAPSLPALIVTTDRYYIGTFINKPLAIKVTIIGGTKPYALKTDWGDDSSSLLPRAESGEFTLQNTYGSSGNKLIKITVTDSSGQTATVQTLAIINGEVAQVTPTSLITSSYSRVFESFLTVLGLLLITVLAFYLGYEWRTRQEEQRQHKLRQLHRPHTAANKR